LEEEEEKRGRGRRRRREEESGLDPHRRGKRSHTLTQSESERLELI